MRLLLTSAGIANTSIRDALAGLLGKPVEESSALVIPTAIYPFPGGAGHAWEAICGRTTSPFAETYRTPRRGSGEALSTEDIVFDTPDGELRMILVKAHGAGLVDFAIIPHVDNADHQDMAIAEQWAARIPAPTYAIDDQTAIKVTDGNVEVVSEGHWKLFGGPW